MLCLKLIGIIFKKPLLLPNYNVGIILNYEDNNKIIVFIKY